MNTINSISDLHRLLSQPKPAHPSVSVIDSAAVKYAVSEVWDQFFLNFYCVALKKNYQGKFKYGRQYYDFNEGTMTFTAPKQVMALDYETGQCCSGFMLLFHPDFISNHPLAATIKDYGFFSYGVSEALHLSEKEELIIEGIAQRIKEEYETIDSHTQGVVVSQIDLLLHYANRFYERQFITRKNNSNDLLVSFEKILNDYFDKDRAQESGLITVQYISGMLNLSPDYLSDLLRIATGRNTQQHIQDKYIEKAKELLTTTSLSVSEIAYELGFEYPQSFNKLFKKKMNVSPLEYKQSFN